MSLSVCFGREDSPAIKHEIYDEISHMMRSNATHMVAERAVYETADLLTFLAEALADEQLEKARRYCVKLISISAQAGLARLGRMAADLIICIDRHDQVALAAVSTRVLRFGNECLFHAIEVFDSRANPPR